MNSSVPGAVSPPVIAAALIRIAAITPTIAQNSVVFNELLVSVANLRDTDLPRSFTAEGARPTDPASMFPPLFSGRALRPRGDYSPGAQHLRCRGPESSRAAPVSGSKRMLPPAG